MGSKKNKGNPHISRGKYKKHKQPICRLKQQDSEVQSIEGSRIINMEKLKSFVSDVSTHSKSCQLGTISLIGETYRGGLASVLSARCSGCRAEIAFPTSSRVASLSGTKRWESNLAAVWGEMVTGGGHAPLAEAMSVLGVPVMTKKSFIAIEKEIGKKWWMSLEESMRAAAEEEKRLAEESESFHDGVPAITVIVDGGWCKRTHKHSYNTKSGVGVVIGLRTGKLLHMGVCNKYCSTCAQADKQNKTPKEHDCFKNWDGASSSMETDIVLQGFREAEKKYGLRYTTFIGDGDSSIHPNLITGVPGWGHIIRKVECANHTVKCYRGALEKLAEQKPHYKGKGRLTESMRKQLTKAARCAIKMRSALTDKKEAAKLLRQDLRNGPYHCFGDHSHCSTDYCRVTESSEQAMTGRMPPTDNAASDESGMSTDVQRIADQEQRLWEDALNEENLDDVRLIPPSSLPIDTEIMCDIQRLVGRLIAKAEQLLGMIFCHMLLCIHVLTDHLLHIGNFTTNLAESWMHIRSKFDGGKQINRSQSGSWEGRCAGAGLRQVLGPAWGPKAWKEATGKEANLIFTSDLKVKQVVADRKRKASEPEKQRRRQVKYKRTNDDSCQARGDYARHDGGPGVKETVCDVPQDYLEQMMLDYYKTNVAITEQKATEVERVTRGQGKASDIAGNIWLAES